MKRNDDTILAKSSHEVRTLVPISIGADSQRRRSWTLSERQRAGSILIWTLTLGVMLTTVFFFFALRLRDSATIQRDVMVHQNQKAYLNSFADYLETLDDTQLENLKGSLNADGITGTLTNEVEGTTGLTGVVDFGQEKSFDFFGDLTIEWNRCSHNLAADMVVIKADTTEEVKNHDTDSPSCAAVSPGYDDTVDVTIPAAPFKLKAVNAPFEYRLTSDSPLTSNQWHFTGRVDLGYGKKVEVERIF